MSRRSLVAQRERRCHRERPALAALGGVHLNLRARGAHRGRELDRPVDRLPELTTRRHAHGTSPFVRQREVDPARAPRDEHELEVRQLRVPPRVAERELARHLHLARQLAADGNRPLEPRLELRRLLEEPEHPHAPRSRSTPSARQRVISSRHRRNQSSSCIEGSAMSPESPASSSVMTRIVSAVTWFGGALMATDAVQYTVPGLTGTLELPRDANAERP